MEKTTAPRPTNSFQAALPDSQGTRPPMTPAGVTRDMLLDDQAALMLPTSTRTPRPMVEDTATLRR